MIHQSEDWGGKAAFTIEFSSAEKEFLVKSMAATLRQLNTRLEGDRRSLESMIEITPSSPAVEGWKRMMEGTRQELVLCNSIWKKLLPPRGAGSGGDA